MLFPDVTYSFYPVYASEYRVNYKQIPLDEEYRIRIEDYFIDNGGIIFPNPNAPTAIALELDEIRTLAEKTDGLLIVDEAYVAFGAQSAVSLTKEYDNILVVRTLSKSHSLAGIRLGYAIGQPALIEGLNRVKNSFNSYTIDRIACVCARESILDTDYAHGNAERIMATRERVSRHLEGLGFTVLPSKANFVFISHPAYEGGEMMKYLRERGILVRHFTGARTHQWLRVTIGTDEEMDVFLSAMDELSEVSK